MRMNQRAVGARTPEGGSALPLETPLKQLERLASCCLLWEKNFYFNGADVAKQMSDLVHKCKPMDVIKLAVRLRTETGLRHTPLWLLAALSAHPARPMYGYAVPQIISRPDDMTELLAMILQGGDRRKGKTKLPKQMQRGLAKAFRKFDEYQLAKYNRPGMAVSLKDALRLAHPKPETEEQSALWKRLATDTLATPNTWEVALSAGENKRDVFENLICDHKLGDMAVLKNLRNMISVGVSDIAISEAIVRLSDGKLPILPQQFIAAWRYAPRFEKELEYAMLRNLAKVPMLSGRTMLMVDVSGSMRDRLSAKSEITRMDVAAALAVMTRAVCEQYRVFTFSNELVEINPAPNGFGLIGAIMNSQHHSGTALGATVEALRNACMADPCDRLIVITDEAAQGHVGGPIGTGYMVNVAVSERGVGFGNWTRIQGWSENIVRFIQAQESAVMVNSGND